MTESNSEQLKPKKSLPRRPRLRNWPIRGYTFAAEIVGEPPAWLAEFEEQMRRCWNDEVGAFKDVIKGLPADADFKAKNEALKPLRDTKSIRAIAQKYKGAVPSSFYMAVANRFQVALRRWPDVRRKVKQRDGFAPFECGMPRFKRFGDASDISFPIVFNRCAGDEVTFADLYSDAAGNVSLWRVVEASSGANHNMQFRPSLTGRKLEPVKVLVKFHRLPPPDAIVKEVRLTRREQSPFPAKWEVGFTLEMPPLKEPRTQTGRVAGYDSGGWRRFDDCIRVGVLTDNAGFFYEISFPFDVGNNVERKARLLRDGYGGCPTTWPEYLALTEEIGNAVQSCKDKLKEIYEGEKDGWPEDARKMMIGLTKMRQAGLRRLSALLSGVETQAASLLAAWDAIDARLHRKASGFQLKTGRIKEDAWRKVSVWIAKNFDAVAWEGDLKLSQMAEAKTNDPTYQAAARYRQYVGQYRLREFVSQAMSKYGRELLDCNAAGSSRVCSVCGGSIAKGRMLLQVCENGHQRDQDVSASLYFLKQIEGRASILSEPVQIPADLRRYVRVMTVTETGIDVV